ncbi:hypothetical protein ACFLVR_03695 [Chloroflexota bacterium]
MEKRYETKLSVNNNDIDLTPFPAEFLANVVIAVATSLKDVDVIKTLELYEDDGNTKLVVNETRITLTTFLNNYITNTINGLISTLRGVDTIKTVKIELTAIN